MKHLYFTPGPTELYFTVHEHLKNALKEDILSLSHRSDKFKVIYADTVASLRELLGLPEDWHIIFASSATEIWERAVQNLVEKNSFHFVSGAFSGKFAACAKRMGKNVVIEEAPFGQVPNPREAIIPLDSEFISFTHNETSSGACQPLEDFAWVRKNNPNALIAVDGISSLPVITLDYEQIDTAYFTVQKCFGLPAGLSVWLVNNRCLAKAEMLEKKGIVTGSYYSLAQRVELSQQNQTPETPNVLAIYLLGKVAKDMLMKGIDQIQRETNYKAAVMYHLLENTPGISPFIQNPEHRSKTTIVASCEKSTQIIEALKSKKLILGAGFGKYKEHHLRIANFPTHSKEQFEMLADKLSEQLDSDQ